jgi:energy-converting hydrogenase Eha subunit G
MIDIITSIAEIIGAILIVAGIFILAGTGAGLISAGISIFILSYLASEPEPKQ